VQPKANWKIAKIISLSLFFVVFLPVFNVFLNCMSRPFMVTNKSRNKNYVQPMHAPKRPKDFSIWVGWMGGADFCGFSAKG